MDLRVPSTARLADALRSVRLSRPGAVGMHLGANAVEAEAVRVPAGRMQFPSRGEQPPGSAAARPAAEPGVDRIPFSEALRQEGADFGALFCHDLFHDCIPLDFYVIFDSHLSMEPSKTQAKILA